MRFLLFPDPAETLRNGGGLGGQAKACVECFCNPKQGAFLCQGFLDLIEVFSDDAHDRGGVLFLQFNQIF